MKCSRCGSDNVAIQMVTKSKLVTKHHGILWWLLIGWWWVFFKWIFLTVPALIFAIFVGKRKKIKTSPAKDPYVKTVDILGIYSLIEIPITIAGEIFKFMTINDSIFSFVFMQNVLSTERSHRSLNLTIAGTDSFTGCNDCDLKDVFCFTLQDKSS